jgi:hypothetical protein
MIKPGWGDLGGSVEWPRENTAVGAQGADHPPPPLPQRRQLEFIEPV